MFSQLSSILVVSIMLIALVGVLTATADTEANKALISRVIDEMFNQRNFDLADQFYANDYVGHIAGNPDTHGPEEVKQFFAMLIDAFPDIHYTVEDAIAEGDQVANRFTALGTHQGEFMGILPTGKQVTLTSSIIHHIVEGKIYEDVFNRKNLDLVDELFATDHVYHLAGNPDIHGPDGFKNFAAAALAAFPDTYYTIEDLIAEGDMVASRWTLTGTHQGEWVGIPPTLKPFNITGIVISRIASGKMVEGWGNPDVLGMMQQLGVIPAEGNENYTWGVPSEVTGEPGDPEENKAILRRVYEEVINQRNLDLVDEIYANDYVFHLPPNPEIHGAEGFKQFFAMYFAAFPDLQFTVEDMFAEEDKVVSRVTMRGTHKGEFMGIPPTGKEVTATGILIQRFADGKIVEDWESFDFLGFMQQLTAPDTEANKALVHRLYEEVLNQKDLSVIDEIFALDYVLHMPGSPDQHGIESQKQMLSMYFPALPDLHYTIDDLVVGADLIASRYTATATHQGELMGIPPTGKQATWTGIIIHRFADGKIVEEWIEWDTMGMMQQLGVIPATGNENYTWGEPSEVTGEPGDPEANKAILRRITEEALNQRNLSLVDEFYATDYVFHLPGTPDIHGPEGFKQYFSTAFAAFPDFHLTTEDMIAEEDKVVSRVTIRGTHKGEFMGIPPTGKEVTATGILIQRFADGKIVEDWESFDFLGFMQQLTPPPVDTEANKALIRRAYEEILNQNNLSVADEIVAADCVLHIPPYPDIHTLEGYKQFVTTNSTAFPDGQYTIEELIAEGDKVAVRWTTLGTHTGEFMGLPPTGKQVKVTAIVIDRIAEGKIVEEWANVDFLGLMQQLGVIPPDSEDFSWGMPSEVTGDPGDPEANKAILHRVLEEVLNQKNLDLADEFYATSYVNHIPPNPEIRGPEGFKQLFAMQFAAFPDFHLTIEDMFAEGDKVVSRGTFLLGTHTGEFMGIPPTGKQVTVTGILIQRFADGKIVEDWGNYDVLGLMQQLGVIPPPEE